MDRDIHGYGSEPGRGLCSKQFVFDLRDQGLSRDGAIVVVSRLFGIPRGAARLFVHSHPAWAEDERGPTSVRWGS